MIDNIVVYNIMGQLIGQFEVDNQKFALGQVLKLPATYIIEVKFTDGKTAYIKAVKN
jgi:hypothetical protein